MQLKRLNPTVSVDGRPLLGTYLAQTEEELSMVADLGMNFVIGDQEDLDLDHPRGKLCRALGIKVLYHMVRHLYHQPRFGGEIDAEQTEIPLSPQEYRKLPDRGLIMADDELIRYGRLGATSLLDCERGVEGTRPSEHREGLILFFPEECAADIEAVKDSPNLWGYYTLDDSPGDALSCLRGIYRTIRRVDGTHPVAAGYGTCGSLLNFGPEVCDVMLIYEYPVSGEGYDRTMVSRKTQLIVADARAQVPGMPFVGVYQAFDGTGDGNALPTARQVREQIEDFVREGASGLVSFICRNGWANHPYMRDVIRTTHQEVLETGGLIVPPEPDECVAARIYPPGFQETPSTLYPGLVPAWWVAAPFDDVNLDRLDAPFPPDDGVDLDAVYQGKSYPIRWRVRRAVGGFLGLGELHGFHSYTSGTLAYAACTVQNPEARRVRLMIGSDDDALVMFNGREIWRFEGARGAKWDQESVEVDLLAGESEIRVKICNRKGTWVLFMRFTDLNGAPIENLSFSPEPSDAGLSAREIR